MKNLYKGYICYKKNIKYNDFFICNYDEFNIDIKSLKANISKYNLNNYSKEFNDQKILIEYLNNHAIPGSIKNKEISQIITKYFKPVLSIDNPYIPIIYEIIIDKDGNKYGKEIISGLIFPIFVSNNENTKYDLATTILDEFYNVLQNKKLILLIY